MVAAAISVPSLPGCLNISTIKEDGPIKTKKIQTAVVLWYSQTGYTERAGKLIAKTFEKNEIIVTACEIKDFDKSKINNFDLIVIGSPVFYYDTPEFVKEWIKSLSEIKGVPVASYVTFGGPEGNQHNAACSIIEELSKKRGVPVGVNYFMNMSSFPLSWSEKGVHGKTWMSRHLPNEETFEKIRIYAKHIINQVKQGKSDEFIKKLTMRECVTLIGPIYWTKMFVKNHSIDKEKCVQCGICEEKCPADAIDLLSQNIDTNACVLCFGCINNCLEDAVYMKYSGEKVFGYRTFLKRKKIKVLEPEELKA